MPETLSAGKVSVTVSPDTSKFSEQLKKGILSQGAGIGASLGGTLLGGLKTMAGPIAAVTAAFSLKHVIDESTEAFEGLAGSTVKIQRLIGGTATEVSGLTGAMKLSGVNADGAGTSLRIFSMKLTAASQDADKAAAMVNKLGTNFLDAQGNLLPMSKLLPAVADKFKDMPNGIEKTALATQLFGRQGTMLLPFLSKGSEGIQELTAKAKEMGLVLDDAGIAKYKESMKAQREFKATIEGLQVQIGEALLPVMEALQNFFRDMLIPAIHQATTFVQQHKAQFDELGKLITSTLQPIVDGFAKFLTGTFIPALRNMVIWIKQNGDLLSALGAIVGGAIAAYMGFRAVTTVINAVKLAQEGYAAASYGATAASYASQGAAKVGAAIYALQNSTIIKGTGAWIANTAAQVANAEGGLIAKASTLVYAVATGIATAAQWAWNAAMTANPIGIIIVAIGALVAGIIWLATKTTFFQDLWKNMTSFVTKAWNSVVSFLSDAWKNIVSFFTKYGLDILLLITVGPIGLMIKWIISNWSGVVKFFGEAWNNIVKFFSNALAAVVANVTRRVSDIITFFKQLPQNILKLLASAGTWLLDVGKNIIDGLMTGLKNASGMIGQWFQNMGNAWINQFKSIFGIHSPSKVFHDFGQNIMQGLKNGLVKDEQGLKDTMQKVSNWVTDAFDNKKITAKTAKAANKLIGIFTAQLKPIVAAHDAVMTKLDGAQKDLADKIKERLDYINSIASKYGASLNITSKTVDPLAVMQGQDAVTSAQADLKNAIADFGDTSREATMASLKLAQAQASLDETMKGSTCRRGPAAQGPDC
jgi:Phage-related minor tail protein